MSQARSTAKKTRCIIKFMISHGSVTDEQFKTIATEIIGSNSELEESEINKLLYDANKQLNPYNMMIRTTIDDLTKDKYQVLISTVDNEITQAAPKYHPRQIEFFKLLLKGIVQSPRGIIAYSTVRAYADRAMLPSSTKYRSTKYECELLFREWSAKRWFITVEEGGIEYVTLSVRSIAELDVFIKQKYIDGAKDLDCKNCDHMSIYSVLCPSCESRFHWRQCAKTSIDPDTNQCKRCSRLARKPSKPNRTPRREKGSSRASQN